MPKNMKIQSPFRNALVSVSDKSGLIEFIKPLADAGMRVVSTGGTAKFLSENGVEVIQVSHQTGFPEVMDGRVKTLHPKIHMALLARSYEPRDQEVLEEYDVEPFDLVVGNLYPFEAEPDIENIDVGGPSFLRAAAKSHERIAVICDPKDYGQVLKSATEKGTLSLGERRTLAAKIYAHTSHYDSMITKWLSAQGEGESASAEKLAITAEYFSELRYGENPQQRAAWFKSAPTGLHLAEILQGKALSFNNLLDLTAAAQTLREFSNEPTCVAVKHNNPCGVASRRTLEEAAKSAVEADPVSVFGGILALNGTIDQPTAEFLSGIFLECIVAPKFSDEAKTVFAKKKNLRLLEWPQIMGHTEQKNIRQIDGGFLTQDVDQVANEFSKDWQVIGEEPSPEIKADLVFAWKVAARLKSNAIAIVEAKQTLGLGMGQVNRVDAVAHALTRKTNSHSTKTKAVLASDAFFPFADSIEKIAKAGLKWVIQPGGSVNDEAVLAKARELKVNLVLTGARHFLH